jgi:hypothetical protein
MFFSLSAEEALASYHLTIVSAILLASFFVTSPLKTSSLYLMPSLFKMLE